MADVALVCGGAGALGSAVVEALRTRGDEVIVADKDTLDLTDAAAVEAYWDALEARPRWVVNAAGGFRPGSVVNSAIGRSPARINGLLMRESASLPVRIKAAKAAPRASSTRSLPKPCSTVSSF